MFAILKCSLRICGSQATKLPLDILLRNMPIYNISHSVSLLFTSTISASSTFACSISAWSALTCKVLLCSIATCSVSTQHQLQFFFYLCSLREIAAYKQPALLDICMNLRRESRRYKKEKNSSTFYQANIMTTFVRATSVTLAQHRGRICSLLNGSYQRNSRDWIVQAVCKQRKPLNLQAVWRYIL